MKQLYSLITMLSLAAATGTAGISVESLHTGIIGDRFHLTMTMRLDSLDIESNRRIIYTPLLISENGDSTVAFKEVMVNGRRQHIAYQRNSAGFKGIEVRRRNNIAQSVEYTTSVSYEPWMDNATLYLADDLCGCGKILDRTRSELATIDMRKKPEPEPETLACFLVPEAEVVKSRSEKGSAYIDFPVNRTEIHPDYRHNSRELDKITSTIDVVRDDANLSITSISIHGYASPEGSYANNDRLAAGRAAALADYVGSLYNFPKTTFAVSSTPEDWEGLRRYVTAATGLDSREAILAIIDNTGLAPDAREWRLKSQFPTQYRMLLAEVYPGLRHSDYEVTYTVRAFNVDEAREIIRTKPQQLSLQELYRVALSYETGSREFNEVFEVAVRMFPDDPTANLNAAIAAFNRRDYEAAQRYIAKGGDSPQAAEVRAALDRATSR